MSILILCWSPVKHNLHHLAMIPSGCICIVNTRGTRTELWWTSNDRYWKSDKRSLTDTYVILMGSVSPVLKYVMLEFMLEVQSWLLFEEEHLRFVTATFIHIYSINEMNSLWRRRSAPSATAWNWLIIQILDVLFTCSVPLVFLKLWWNSVPPPNNCSNINHI